MSYRSQICTEIHRVCVLWFSKTLCSLSGESAEWAKQGYHGVGLVDAVYQILDWNPPYCNISLKHIQNRKHKCEYIPYCHVHLNQLLKCVSLHLSTQTHQLCLYILGGVEQQTRKWQEFHSFNSISHLKTFTVSTTVSFDFLGFGCTRFSSTAFKACWSYVRGICCGMWWMLSVPFWQCYTCMICTQTICSPLMLGIEVDVCT